MKLVSPAGGIVDAKGAHADKLRSLGWTPVEEPKADKPKTARTRRTKKTE